MPTPAAPLSGRWQDWRQQGVSGWWSWRVPWRVPWRRLPRFIARNNAASAMATGHSPEVKARAGYAQLEAASAALEHEARLLEGWLSFAVRHLLGAFGSHGIDELDLDSPSIEL